MSNYKQVVVWRGLVLSESDTPTKEDINDFETYLDKEMKFKVKYITEYKTSADRKNGKKVEDTGGRNDVLFYIHKDNIPKFAMWKLQTSGEVSWREDYQDNGGRKLITLNKYNEIKEKTNA